MKQRRIDDDEIARILGKADPYVPDPPAPDPDELAQSKFYADVRGWLEKRVDIADLQAGLITPQTLPEFVAEARAFLAAATPQHECWWFSSPQSDWDRLAGQAGYALVHNGIVTHAIVILLN